MFRRIEQAQTDNNHCLHIPVFGRIKQEARPDDYDVERIAFSVDLLATLWATDCFCHCLKYHKESDHPNSVDVRHQNARFAVAPVEHVFAMITTSKAPISTSNMGCMYQLPREEFHNMILARHLPSHCWTGNC